MSELKKILSKNDFSFKKKFGQNFIKDDSVLNKIIEDSGINKETLVIEIGVGAGVLTKKLAENSKNVIGYEIDKSLTSVLNESLNSYSNIKIIYDDFLNRNIKDDIEPYSYEKIYVVANIPYYITTPIITKIIESGVDIEKIVIMIQKEVADRLSAKSGSRDYNSLSVFINYYYDVKKLFNVSRHVFIPEPNVDSAVISLTKNKKYDVIDEKVFFKLVRDSFQFKRKTIKNNLGNYDLNTVESILKKYGYDLSVRAEQLDIKIFVDIANALS